MKQIQTVLVPAEGFIGWGGGVDYLKVQMKLLIKTSRVNPSLKIILLIPKLSIGSKFIQLIKMIIKYTTHLLPVNKSFKGEYLLLADPEIKNSVEIVSYYSNKKNGKKSIQAIAKKQKNPLVFLTFKPIYNLHCMQVGYIPDLQHISMPQFFTQKECAIRDKSFKDLLSRCDGIIVNSKDVKHHLLAVYPEYCAKTKIFSSPFIPLADELLLNTVQDVSMYKLPEKYFIISNQLWVHKDHRTAFKALRILHDKGYNEVEIICTGKMDDYRFPQYYQEIQDYVTRLNLADSIHFMGFIPKEYQITIMRRSVGLIQPTLFEGGPGGGAVYDAIAYGIPSIISDIVINQEIEHPSVLFFQVQNSNDLTEKMIQLLENPVYRPSIDDLKIQKMNNIMQGMQFLQAVFNDL
jgi:glycosyltransferase involved in cell wall biosynthesis